MRTANQRLRFAATLAFLISGHAPLRAQPAGTPEPGRDEPAPAEGGAPTPAEGGAPTPDEGGAPSPAQGGAPSPAEGPHTSPGGLPAPRASPLPLAGASFPWYHGVSDADRRAARALFLEGNRLFRIPLFAKAAEKYTAALARWKHPAFYFNLALAQLNLGMEVEAHESLQHALRFGVAPLGQQQFVEAQRQLQEVKRQIGQLRVTCQTPGAEVSLDGVPLFTGPGRYQGWVKAKDHELTARKAGYLSEARRVTVSAGQLQDLDLRLVTLGQATDASRRWAAWKPWAVVAAGGAAAIAGGVLHALSYKNFSDYDDELRRLPCTTDPPGAPPGCTSAEIGAELNARLSRAEQQQSLAVKAYVAGGSLAAAGVVLLYLNRPRLSEQRAPRASNRTMTVAPIVSEHVLGVSVSVGR